MVYKKYIYKKGKKFGPYYFKSVRNSDGSVKSIYLGRRHPSYKLGIFALAFFSLFLISFLGYFSYNAFIVADVSEEEISEELDVVEEIEDSEKIPEFIEIEKEVVEEETGTEENETEEEIIEEEINETEEIEINETEEIEVNESLDFEINETEINDSVEELINGTEEVDVIELNETDINGSVIGDINITEEFNETLVNNTLINETRALNVTEINETRALNVTEINETVNITSVNETVISFNGSLVNKTIIDTYSNVKINEPVKWEKRIILEKEVTGLDIYLPENAEDVIVFKIEDNGEFEINFDEEIDKPLGAITGNVIVDVDKIGKSILDFLKDIFRFTGLVVFNESSRDPDLVVPGLVKEVKVEYSLPGPVSEEVWVSDWQKQVKLSSNITYANVTVYSEINDTKGGIMVYDSSGKEVSIVHHDLNENGLTDYIEWNSPLSNETFNVSIVVLNFQSFPVVGRNWTVMFNTTGRADLRITPINGTTWGTVGNDNDLMFLDVRCGDDVMESYWENNTVVISNYSCDLTGYESSRVRTSGGHYLEFDFGGQIAYARNAAVCGDVINKATTLTGDLIDCSGSYGIAIQRGVGNFVLDCAGFMIDGTSGSTDGIYFQSNYQITVKNCNIQQMEYGILSWGNIYDNVIKNNTVHDVTINGIYLYDADGIGMYNNSIVNNTINYTNTGNDGILLIKGTNHNVSHNVIYDVDYFGLTEQYITDSLIEYNIVENTTSTTGSGIRAYRGNNNTFYGNNVTNSGDYGIRIEGENNSVFDSNRVSGSADDNIYIYSGAFGNIVKNNVVFDADTVMGIYLANAGTSNNTIENNTIYDNPQNGVGVGVWNVQAGPYNVIANNTIYGNVQRGVFVNSENTTIYNNDIYNNTLRGIYLYSDTANELFPHGSNVSHNWVYNNTAEGIALSYANSTTIEYNNFTANRPSTAYGGSNSFVDSHFNVFTENRFIGGGDFLIRAYIQFSNNTFVNNIFANSTDNLFYCGDASGCDYNTFIGDIFETNGSEQGMYLGTAEGNTFVDVTFIGGSGRNPEISSGANNTVFINSTWTNPYYVSANRFIRKWYLDVNVTNSSADAVQNANVSVYNTSGTLSFTELTNSTGDINRWNLTEFVFDSGSYTWFTNYTVNTTSPSGDYQNDSTVLNLSESIKLNIALIDFDYPPVMQTQRITPVSPVTADDLAGFCNATDVNGDNLTYCYKWYDDLVLNQSGCDYLIGLCYQEFSNVSTDCGGLATGSYLCDANWWADPFDCAKTYDGDWDTYGVSDIGLTATMLVNYSIPPTAQIEGSLWQIKDTTTINLSVNADCWGDPLQFKISSTISSSSTSWDCMNVSSGSWRKLRSATGGSVIYEEAMIWNMTDQSEGVEYNVNNLSSSLTNKGDNWTLSCIANDGSQNATNWDNASVIIGNTIPTINSSRISPTTVYTNDTLMGFCNGTDVDLDTLAYRWKWYQDGSLIFNGISSIIEVDDTEDEFYGASGGLIINPTNAVDENWDTFAFVGIFTGTMYINYTIPTNTNAAVLEHKVSSHIACSVGGGISCWTDGWVLFNTWDPGDSYTANVSIPQDCINGKDELFLRVGLECGDLTKYTRFYEEQVLWSKTAYSTAEVEASAHNLTSNYTTKGENWTLSCMSYDGTDNSTNWKNSSSVEILNALPSQVSLDSPANDTSINDRPPTFSWSAATDVDDDLLTYHFILDDSYDFSGPESNVTDIGATSYVPTGYLDTDVMYYWKVRANDGVGWGPWSEIWAVTIDSLVDLSLTNAMVNFSSLAPGENANTTDPAYSPFVLQNDGNVLSNVSINATALFDAVALNTGYYMFKLDNVTGEEISLNWSTSLWNWTNMTDVSTFMAESLNYSDTQDSCEIDILVSVIGYEPTGDKRSNVTFVGSISE